MFLTLWIQKHFSVTIVLQESVRGYFMNGGKNAFACVDTLHGHNHSSIEFTSFANSPVVPFSILIKTKDVNFFFKTIFFQKQQSIKNMHKLYKPVITKGGSQS